MTPGSTEAKDRESAVILCVAVERLSAPGVDPPREVAAREWWLPYVCDRLKNLGGREESRSPADAVYRFDRWTEAVAAAIAVTAPALGSSTQLAGIHLGVGIDLVPANGDGRSRTTSALAESAGPNEILIGPALAAVAAQDPPDYYAVRPVEAQTDRLDTVHTLVRAVEKVPTNLVPSPTSFVGREADVSRVRHMLGEARLVTVTGAPGAGKTRIATEIGQRMLGGFEDGVWFVPLASVTDPALVLSAVADALNLRPTADGSLIELLTERLTDKHALIVLDNFEHVDGAADDVHSLLEATRTCKVLVTSRTLLRLSGEHEYALQPLELPRTTMTPEELAGTEAVALFVHRAATAVPAFRVDADTLRQIGEVCHRLDGLPLALELAAARTKLLPLSAVLARLDHRLALLNRGPRDVPARHQSLRAAVAWSYDLLNPEGQALFRGLSVFRGGWTIDAAQSVCADGRSQDSVLETLGLLLEASLLTSQVPSSVTPRFAMLETLREFAAERLDDAGESELARSRHAAYYLELLEGMESEFTGRDPRAALDRIGEEHDNIRTALRFLVTSAPEAGVRLASAMWRFWQMRGHLLEGSRWLAEALEAAGNDVPAEVRAKALTAAGGIAYWRGRMDEVQPLYEGAVALRRTVGDEVLLADALYDLGFVFQPEYSPPPVDPSRTARAMNLVAEAEHLYERAGHQPGLAKSMWLRGNLHLSSDSHAAKRFLGESVERFRALEDTFGLGWALYSYGLALLGTSELDAAAAAFGEAIRLFEAAGDVSAMGLLLEAFGEVAAAEGDALRASRLRGAATGNRLAAEAELAFVNPPWLVDGSSASTRSILLRSKPRGTRAAL
jgi:predicted ATPase